MTPLAHHAGEQALAQLAVGKARLADAWSGLIRKGSRRRG
jgi:hypothetical protein